MDATTDTTEPLSVMVLGITLPLPSIPYGKEKGKKKLFHFSHTIDYSVSVTNMHTCISQLIMGMN